MARLVSEEAEDRAVGEEAGEALRVNLVREFDEPSDGLRLADVHPSGGGDGLLPEPAAARTRKDAGLAVAPGLVLGRNAPLAGTARPGVFVVEPDLEAAPDGLVAEPFGELQPLLAHVGHLEAAAGVDEETFRAASLDGRDLSADFFLRRRARDGQKRDHARGRHCRFHG